jgi:uroporphyrin-III C-methyltransferase
VGKEPRQHRLSQQTINELLVQQARQGKRVVRLKGGDPFVFGRGGEECQALADAGIPYEVIPGISSAIGVPAYAGIPVTQRYMAHAFTVITGHSCDVSDPLGTDWEDLPRKGTIVILMGVRHLPQIAERLIAGGRSPDIPAATIFQGTTPLQETVEGTLGTIAELASHIRPPAITIVGEVVSLRQQINWLATPELQLEEV